MNAIDQAERAVALAVRAAGILLLLAIIAIIAIQILSRSMFHNPVIWTEELARFSLIWLTLLGCGWLAFTGNHMGLGLKSLGASIRDKVWGIAVRIFTIIIVIWFGIAALNALGSFPTSSAALRVPTWAVYLSVPVGMGLWAIHEILSLIRIGMGRNPQNPTGAADDHMIPDTE
ncbi:TRAP transporter small permease [Arthrobacter sp. AB6]|uniref:TRAP transporter small permease n=1 Tax=Arthrobacter sp. AB6 TaxID=2962570 RepID=UPI002882B5EA|nr:TRAP transporter small permease [Arthrobacter sp. AB6]MDT0196760.1 TRAP transporter small permease [Arthrobacter sp. AB6]